MLGLRHLFSKSVCLSSMIVITFEPAGQRFSSIGNRNETVRDQEIHYTLCSLSVFETKYLIGNIDKAKSRTLCDYHKGNTMLRF